MFKAVNVPTKSELKKMGADEPMPEAEPLGYHRTLVVELKSRRYKKASPKKKKPIEQVKVGSYPSVYGSSPGQVLYVMSAKMTKRVNIEFKKSLLGSTTQDYGAPTIEADAQVKTVDHVVHRKK